MKLLAFAVVVLLGVIAIRIPTPLQIGRGILQAQEERRDELVKAQLKIDEEEKNQRAEQRNAEEAPRRQAEDEARRVANLKVPVATPKARATPDPRSSALDILHKYSQP
jgi:hypothetical protein